MYYQNVRGLRTKLDDLHFNSTFSNYDILALTETWLIPSISDAELGCDSFTIYRRDRFSHSESTRSGGGILVAVSSAYISHIIPLPATDVEQLAVFISAPYKIILVCSYVTPASHSDVYIQHLNNIRCITERYSNIPICYLGDFNLPDVEWSLSADSPDEAPFISCSAKSRLICNDIISLGLAQTNHLKNILGRTLDLIFLSPEVVGACNPPISHIIHPDSHHPPIELIIHNLPRLPLPHTTFLIRRSDFNKADYDLINAYLGNINWSSWIMDTDDLSAAYNSFITILRLAIDLFVPITSIRPASKPKWHNKSYQRLLNAKSNAHKRWKKSYSPSDRNFYLQLRRECNLLGKFLRRQYFAKVEASINSDPSNFWRVVNSRRTASNAIPLCSYQSTKASSTEECAQLFANFFNSSYEPPISHPSVNIPILPALNVPPLVVDSLSVKKAIDNLKSSPIPGPDGIPTLLIKRCPALIEPIQLLANRSFREGTFFNEGKVAHIIPIFKKGNHSMVENYRPIAKLSAIPKLIEGLVASHLQVSLSGQIDPFQHGFVRRRSTATNLASFCQVASDALEDDNQLDVLFIDFAKAFDKVDHTRLVLKLEKIGLAESLTRWVSSFLSSWTYRVKIHNYTSQSFSPSSGVPQGTHLGPILFIIFTLDLPLCLNFCKALSFADDTKIFSKISSVLDTDSFQRDIDSFVNWCSSNGLHLNSSKCHIMTIHKGSSPIIAPYHMFNAPLVRVESVKDLGVSYNDKLDFSPHIQDICSRAFRLLGFIKRNAGLFSNYLSVCRLFTSLIRSLLEFSSCVWNPYIDKHISLIESIQRNFTRFVFNKYHLINPNGDRPSYSQRCVILNLQLLSDRRAIADALFIRGILLDEIDSIFLRSIISLRNPEYPLRHFRPINEISHRTNRALNAPVSRCTRQFNLFFANNILDPLACSRDSFITHCRTSLSSSH